MRRQCLLRVTLSVVAVALIVGQLSAQGGPPWSGRGKGMGRAAAQGNRGFGRGPASARQGNGPDAQFVADRDVFHSLLQNHDKVRREVKNTPNGVETLTESESPEVAAQIQQHVAAMAKRVEEGRPIHTRDPLFAELFRNASKIHLTYKKTEKGVRVVETSDDPHTVQLIQAHGGVVSLFVKNGFEEARTNHEPPGAATVPTAAPASGPVSVGCPCPGCPLASAAGGGCAGRCPAAANCPNAATCPAAANCPKATACPNAANCPKASACPNAANCPNAATCPAGANCPKATACPNAANCPKAAGGGCAAGAFPLSTASEAPPLPKDAEKRD